MPFYDFQCTECEKEFNIMASMTQKAEKQIECPECGSRELKTVFKSAPYYIKGSKTTECPNSHICGSACSHGRAG